MFALLSYISLPEFLHTGDRELLPCFEKAETVTECKIGLQQACPGDGLDVG